MMKLGKTLPAADTHILTVIWSNLDIWKIEMRMHDTLKRLDKDVFLNNFSMKCLK